MTKTISGDTWRVGCHGNGPATGRVVIVRSQTDLSEVREGDILVANQTDVNYTAQMLIATAVVTVEGGRFSHAATFCRENNIVCLIGATGVMDELQTGQTITVDTRAKTIEVKA